MASPLAFIANAHLVINAPGAPTMENGRITSTPGQLYAIRLYLARQDSAGITTGWEYEPRRSDKGSVMSGAGGIVALHRGYALTWSTYTDGALLPTGGSEILSSTVPSFLFSGQEGVLYNGRRGALHCYIESVHGRYGGAGIDEMISKEVRGVPVQLRVGEVID
jgi:hypothetical protein